MNYSDLNRHYIVSRETYEKLCSYVEMINKWQARLNLIGPDTLNDIWERHIIDSLQLAPLLPDAPLNAIDLGSGAGLPAIPLGIATPHHFNLIESDQRKAVFLNEASRKLGISLTVHTCRIEDSTLKNIQLVTARACASLSQLLAWAQPLLSTNGKCLFHKGRNYRNELKEAAIHWEFVYEVHPSKTDSAAAIIEISHVSQRL